jgi:hypothetical protein
LGKFSFLKDILYVLAHIRFAGSIQLNQLRLTKPYGLVLQLYIKFQRTVIILINQYFTGRIFFCHVNLSPHYLSADLLTSTMFALSREARMCQTNPMAFSFFQAALYEQRAECLYLLSKLSGNALTLYVDVVNVNNILLDFY